MQEENTNAANNIVFEADDDDHTMVMMFGWQQVLQMFTANAI